MDSLYRVQYLQDNYTLLVELNIENNIDIPLNSISKIVNEDIMGSKGIALLLGDSNINIGIFNSSFHG